ncbi:hypothetical protein D0T53_05755 [Dysgonomonas sp. 216]|uniref:hypothetical protein n=1 Tax=Dysgonomonas sp. 216 TaxID=2302934 RepID=UPI0013D34A7A|nr:hypothetical protein [Dysgonomonas sp. 216]NDW18420.1 hypothetical protein [Dysgonomonas sp. 216]
MNKLKQICNVILISSLFVFLFTQCDNAVNKALKLVAQETNKLLPMQYDASTTLLKVEAEGTTLKYYYEIGDNINFDAVTSEANKKQVQENLLQVLVNSKELAALRTMDVSFLHEYKSKKGEVLMSINITPDMYKNYKPKNESLEDILTDLVEIHSKTLPVEIAPGISWSSTKVEGGNTLVYEYTIPKEAGVQMDSNSAEVKQKLADGIKSDNTLMNVRTKGGNFKFVYVDANGTEYASYTVTPADYK